MSWENYGKEWCIDHIAPLDLFGESLNDLKLAWHYLNLRPETISNNRNKSACLFASKFEISERLRFYPDNAILQALNERIVLPIRGEEYYGGLI